jgi:hypothetical protein
MVEAERTGLNASHFGMQVASTDDVLEAKTRFESVGLKTRTEENTACCYAVQDKVWVEDPDGNEWEVFFVKADADVMRESDKVSAAKDRPCCSPGCCPPARSDAKRI